MKPSNATEQTIFDAARQLPDAPARAAYLDSACAGDAPLRERVEKLLQAGQRADDFLAADPLGLGESVRQTIVVPPSSEGPGTVIGNYKLLEKLGEGGFGVVYMAEQKQPIKRRVALKIIKVGMDTREVVARFEAERQALALMDHPNIAKVFDGGCTGVSLTPSLSPTGGEGARRAGEADSGSVDSQLSTFNPQLPAGRPYFVMELVRGTKITDYCDEKHLSTRERLDLFAHVCQAVQHAHQKGIIHRDLKPSNILVTVNDGVAVPKIIDFGIAKATQLELTEKTVFTRFHQFLGTPAYMSPEQAELTSVDIDTRSDIYSLGVLLYELLTGETPFDTKELLKAGLDEMRRTIREVEPVKPSTRLSQSSGARSPSPLPTRHSPLATDLDWIVMKCLEKDRARRYETANGLAADIQRHLNNEPVVACPPSTAYRLQKMLRRNKLAFAAGAAVAAALLFGIVVSTWQAVRATRERNAKEVARQDAEAISKFLSEVFQSPDPERDGRAITVAETLDKAAKKLANDLAGQPARRAKLQATLGRTYNALGLFREAIPLLEKVRDYNLGKSGLEHPDTLRAMHSLAISYAATGRRDEALRLEEEVLTLRRKLLGPEHLDTLEAMNNLASSYHDAGRRDEALKLQQEVLSLRRKVLGPEHPDTLGAMHNLASFYHDAGHRDEALKLREEVLTLRRKVSGPEHPHTLAAMDNLARSYADVGRREEALKLQQEVLPLRRKVLGPEHPDTLGAMHNLASSYADAGRWDEALKLREEVLTLRRRVNGLEHPDTLDAMNNLALSYADTGRQDEALKLREEVLTLRRRVNGPEHPGTLGAMGNLANSCADAGRRDEALKLREEVLPLFRKVLGPEHPETLTAMNNLALSYADTGRRDEARKLFEEVLPLRRRVNGPEHPDTLTAMNALAWLLATAPDPKVRDGRSAVTNAEKVVTATGRMNAGYLDTLAAAYAEAGDFTKAVTVQKEATALLRTEKEKEDFASRLKLYESNTPYRERE